MPSQAEIRKLKAQVKSYLDLKDSEIMRWWVSRNAVLGGKRPSDMAKNPHEWRKLVSIVHDSDLDLDCLGIVSGAKSRRSLKRASD